MSTWTRIGDDDHAPFGKRIITFPIDGSVYVVAVDEADQQKILVTFGTTTNPWSVEYKEVNGGVFRLSGFAWGRGDPHHDGNFQGYWFELTLSERSTVRYWGDRVVLQEDNEIMISN